MLKVTSPITHKGTIEDQGKKEFLQIQTICETKDPIHFHGKKAQKSILTVEAVVKVRYCKTYADLWLTPLRLGRVFMFPSLTQHRSRQSINQGPENYTAQPSTVVPKTIQMLTTLTPLGQ